MISAGTFTVTEFVPVEEITEIVTALPAGYARLVKSYSGEVIGRSITQFTSAFDQETGVGTYLALESFEGLVGGRGGTFAFLHTASTSGSDRTNEFSAIVPNSGTGELIGITGTAQLTIEADGTQRMTFEYALPGGEQK